MCEVLATLQCFLAPLHSLDETGLLLEMSRNNFLNQLIRFTALLSSRLGNLRFEFGSEVYFHDLQDTGKLGLKQCLGASRATRERHGKPPTMTYLTLWAPKADKRSL